MSDNIIELVANQTTTGDKPKDLEGPQIRTYRITYTDGDTHDATGVLVTTSTFVAVGTHTEDGHGVNFEAYAPVSMVKHVHRILEA